MLVIEKMEKDENKTTVVIGATTNPSRYAFLAVNALQRHGHEVIPVGIKKGDINGTPILSDIPNREIDTITLYLNAQRQQEWYDRIISAKPKRVIFNPGTINPELEDLLSKAGIEVVQACTLVMLQSRHY